MVRFLLESGDDQNVLGDLGATPLHIAAERGHLETWMMHRYLMDRHAKSSSCSLRFVRKNPSWLGVGNPHHWISWKGGGALFAGDASRSKQGEPTWCSSHPYGCHEWPFDGGAVVG